MPCRLLVLGATAFLCALGVPACGGLPSFPLDAEPAAFRLVTWNVHDLFDEVDRAEPPGDQDTVPAPAEVEAKLRRVGDVLARIDADVVVLQEVENLPLLRRLAMGALAGRGYEPFLVDGLDPRGIDVAVLSRWPVLRFESHTSDRAPDGALLWSRALVEVHVAAAGQRVILLANHLVSRRDPRADPRRALQASRVREVADERRSAWPDALVVVAGDLNDEPGSPPLRPLLGDGVWLDVASALPAASAWTWGGARGASRLDYILVGRHDHKRVLRVEVIGGGGVQAASDHRPLVVDLWLGPERG